MRTLTTFETLVLGLCAAACSEGGPSVGSTQSDLTPDGRGAPHAAAPQTAQALDPGAALADATLSGSGGPDGTWAGTGAEDPLPLRKISDDEMLARASASGAGPDRQHALVSIGRRKPPGAMPALEAALRDDALGVREMALSGLVEHGGSEALELMWRVLREDPAPQLRGSAIWAIAMYGPTPARAAVELGLEHSDPGVRGMAVLASRAVAKADMPWVIEVAKAALAAEARVLWQEGPQVLSDLPHPMAAQALREMVDTAPTAEKRNRARAAYRQWLKRFPDLR